MGLGVFIFYYILFTLGKSLADDTQLPVILAMWLPNAIFFTLAIYTIRQAARERSAIPLSIKRVVGIVAEKTMAPFKKQYENIAKAFQSRSTSQAKMTTTSLDSAALPAKQVLSSEEASNYLTEGTVHGNVISHIFHIQGCEHYYCKNCTIEFKDVTLAVKSGFEPCRFCKNLLEK